MYKDKKILCIIPARGGSKRLPGKNIKLLNGKPLIGYAIEAARGSKYIDRVVVSTDDEAIASVAKEFGAEVPFMRPEELASDTATSLETLQHAVDAVEAKGALYDLIMLIQPTVPGVLSTDVDAAIEKLTVTGTNSCITVYEIGEPEAWMCKIDGSGKITAHSKALPTKDQDVKNLYKINGAVYVMVRDVLIKENKIIDVANGAVVVMPKERSVDIDTAFDFTLAEALLKSGNL